MVLAIIRHQTEEHCTHTQAPVLDSLTVPNLAKYWNYGFGKNLPYPF